MNEREVFLEKNLKYLLPIMSQIFLDLNREKANYPLFKFISKGIKIIAGLFKNEKLFNQYISFEINNETHIIKNILDLYFNEFLRKESDHLNSKEMCLKISENLNQILDISTNGILTGSLKDLSQDMLNFLIKLFDPKTIHSEVFNFLFNEKEPVLFYSIKIILNLIEKELIISALLPIIFFSPLEKNVQKTFKDFFFIIKEFSLSENPQNFMKVLLSCLSFEKKLSQDVVSFEELFMIFNEMIFLMNSENFLSIKEDFPLLISQFFLEKIDELQKKENFKNDLKVSLKKIFKEKEVFISLLKSDGFIKKFFSKTVNSQNSSLFFLFLDSFYRFALTENAAYSSDSNLRTQFFQAMGDYLKKIKEQFEEPDEFQENLLIFFCVFIEIIIFQHLKFQTFEEVFKKPDDAICLDVLFHEKVGN